MEDGRGGKCSALGGRVVGDEGDQEREDESKNEHDGRGEWPTEYTENTEGAGELRYFCGFRVVRGPNAWD